MKQNSNSTANLRPTFFGQSSDIEFGDLLQILAASTSTGILRATSEGQAFEFRFVDGLIVRATGREGQAPVEMVAELLFATEGSWGFRATLGTPNGEDALLVDSLLVDAAFLTMAHAN